MCLLGPAEWEESLHFASRNLHLEHFTGICCIKGTTNLGKVDHWFSSCFPSVIFLFSKRFIYIILAMNGPSVFLSVFPNWHTLLDED